MQELPVVYYSSARWLHFTIFMHVIKNSKRCWKVPDTKKGPVFK